MRGQSLSVKAFRGRTQSTLISVISNNRVDSEGDDGSMPTSETVLQINEVKMRFVDAAVNGDVSHLVAYIWLRSAVREHIRHNVVTSFLPSYFYVKALHRWRWAFQKT